MTKKEKVSLSDKVTEDFKQLIIYGELKPGELITVGEIADKYRISNTPVRDAFNRLVQRGLLDIIPFKGYMVSQLDFKKLDDLFTIRSLLEGGVIEIVTEKATWKDIEKLEVLANTPFNSSDANSEVAFMKTNLAFHLSLTKIANNQYLTDLVNDTLERMQRILYIDLKLGDPESMKNEHLELIHFIKRRDTKKAKELMISHIEDTRSRVFNKH
ncbi:GntR family transcriptional regulator [Virgibacillus sp. W0430]|uniref:GntR family transcriptional regulator n=1 Tax=Virgibacillus sp. W0430 TaxID=3391580 RepID=UPI003F44C911